MIERVDIAQDRSIHRWRRQLTAYQRDLWMVVDLFPGVPCYISGLQAHLVGDIDIDLLIACYRRAWQRHDGMRVRFGVADGVPYQEFATELPPIEHHDLSAHADPEAAARAVIGASMCSPIDLRDGRVPLQLTLLRESATSYRVLLRSHHVATDATGLFILAAHILAEYNIVTTTGEPADVAGSSFLECIDRAHEYRQSEQWQADRDFLLAQAGDTPAVLFDRPSREPAPVARYRCELPRSYADRVRAAGLPFFPYLCTIVGTYLSHVLRSDDITIGIPLNNRIGAETGVAGGHLANTLPLRVEFGDQRHLTDVVADVKRRVQDTKARQRFALGDLMTELRRSGGDVGPLFDVTVNYLRLPQVAALSPIVESVDGLPQGTDLLTLAVHVHEFDADGPMELIFDYATDVFDEDYPIEAVEAALKTLFDAGLAALDSDPRTLPMVTAEDHDTLVDRNRQTTPPCDRSAGVIGRIAEQIAQNPHLPAVLSLGGAPLTYAQLGARVAGLTAALGERGIGSGDRVGVVLQRSPDLVVAILAVMHAGAAYVPVDPRHPVERVTQVLRDADVSAVIADGALGADLGQFTVLGPASGTAQPAGRLDGDSPHGRELAYVMYTSGSTGQPKGVGVEHHSLINRLEWMQRNYPIGPGDVIMHKTSISFDVSVWELFWWAMHGAAVGLPPPGAERDPREILDTVSQLGVTVMHFVPSMLTPFLDLLEERPDAVTRAAGLRVVFCSGESLRPQQVVRFNRAFAHLGDRAPRLVNLYGPTEATVDVSSFDCPRDPLRAPRRVPIGRPIDNIRLYVLGRTGHPQPTGVPGELCVAGAGLARGYLGRPDLAAQRFVADPFHPGERMYRTGDLARRLADGQLDYLGRIDRQVKVRGHRVEPAEVENAITAVPGVSDAVVVTAETDTRAPHLMAFYVCPGTGPFVDAGSLRAHLADHLPDFMVPARLHRVAAIPLTVSGKPDRAALFDSWSDTAPAVVTQPHDDVQAALVAVWQQVLDVEQVGIGDNFFDLGGDSILTLRVRALAEARGILVDTRDIARYPTVAELARHVTTGFDPVPAVRPFELVAGADRPRLTGLADAYPLTRLQLGMLFHSLERAGSSVYHDVFRYSLRMPWHEQAWRTALNLAVARHPVLRMSFDLAGFSEPLALVHPGAAAHCDIVDLRDADPARADTVLRHHVDSHRRGGYLLDRAGLYHFGIFLLADRIDVVFAFHHAILDGWSVSTVLAEILQDYRHLGGADVPAVTGADLPSFAEHVRAEQRSLTGHADRDHWTQTLADAPAIRIPGMRSHVTPAQDIYETTPARDERIRHTLAIPAPLAARITRVAATEHVPVKSLYLAAHLIAVGLFAGRTDVTTGVVTHTRPQRSHADRVAGLFLNTVALRVDTAAMTWRSVVHAAFERERANAAHAGYPLAEIQRATDHAVEVAFNYVDFSRVSSLLAAADVELLDIEINEDTNFAVLATVSRDPRDGTVALRLDGDPALYTAEQLDQIAAAYLFALQRICSDPDAEVAFSAPPATVVEIATVQTVTARFAEQARTRPDEVALRAGASSLTYAELDAMADRVAAGLLRHGTRSGDLVALSTGRGPAQIAAVLGIARAGAACVPIDMTYPPAHRAAMLDQAAPAVVLTDGPAPTGRRPHLALPDLLGTPAGSVALPTVRATEPAYVLFTSGSTGTPKGVVMSHRALGNLVDWQLSVPSGWCEPAGRAPSTLQFAPLSFDVAFQEIYTTLCGGGTLVLISEDQRLDLPALLDVLDATGTQRVFLPYVALQPLAEAAVARGSVPACLRVIVSSGEQLRVTDEIRRFCAAIDDVILENQYGPTETHVVSHETMTGDPRQFPALPPVGTSIHNVSVLVLDARQRPVPDGVPGEIWIAGAAVADGYLGRADLTDAAFQQIPPAGGLPAYRTGDLGRRLPDGRIVLDGRLDTQTKVRGHRVDPMEVEVALRRAAAGLPVAEVAVVARSTSASSSAATQLVAFLVGNPAGDVSQRLRKTLHDKLPGHLVPARFEWIDALPCTPSGKRADAVLSTMALPAPVTCAVEPRDAHEAVIAGLVADLLAVPHVSVLDDFVSLGGDSVSAVRLIVGIEQRFGVSVPMSMLAAGATVADLAKRVRHRGAVALDPVVPLKPAGERPPLFLVHPIGGTVLCYADLASHLPADQPLYALQAAGIEPGTTATDSVPRMAADYLRAIRRIQPRGPYHIGGWSLGGLIAFEMARQLSEAGDELGSVLLLDTMTLRAGTPAEVPAEQLYSFFFAELLWGTAGSVTTLPAIPSSVDSDEAALDYILAAAVEHGALPGVGSRPLLRRLFGTFRACWRAAADYRPTACALDVTLLRASEPLPPTLRHAHDAAGSRYGEAANGWERYVEGRLEVRDVPGDHLSMVTEPHVAVLATALAAIVDESSRSLEMTS
ncbi:amino acid adenylation domain-containing protein [Mycolicibacterium sp. CBM1]